MGQWEESFSWCRRSLHRLLAPWWLERLLSAPNPMHPSCTGALGLVVPPTYGFPITFLNNLTPSNRTC